MHFLQSPSPQPPMPLSIPSATLPHDEALSLAKALQIQLYLSLIPAAMLFYDIRASILQIMSL